MMHDEVFIKVPNKVKDSSEFTLHTFISYFMEQGKYELLKKLGFNYRSFKNSGGVLFVTSLDIDFNFPVTCSHELYIKIELLDIHGSRIRIESMIYNQNGGLVATAISTFLTAGKSGANNDLIDYFDYKDKEVEEAMSYQ